MEPHWFAVQSKPCRENLAALHLEKLDAEVFLPKIKRDQVICGVTRVVVKSLFAGYFFARFCPLLLHDAVRYAPGVLRVVGTRDFPIPLPPEIIDAIRERVQTDGFIRFEAPSFSPGEDVAIEEGPLAGWFGKIEKEWDDGKRVLILLNTIQNQTRLIIEKHCLSRLAAPH